MRKDVVTCPRKLDGVLTPLGSPVLQGASLVVYSLYLDVYYPRRRGTLDESSPNRDFGP